MEARYLALAKQVMQFEKARFQEWAGRAEEATRAQLRRPILLEDAATGRCMQHKPACMRQQLKGYGAWCLSPSLS